MTSPLERLKQSVSFPVLATLPVSVPASLPVSPPPFSQPPSVVEKFAASNQSATSARTTGPEARKTVFSPLAMLVQPKEVEKLAGATAWRKNDINPMKALIPVAELCVSAATVTVFATAILISADFAVLAALPKSLSLPMSLLGITMAGAQGALAFRRWKKGLAALTAVEERAKRRGITDPLTGLANRAGYRVAVEDALSARRSDKQVGIVYVDLDRFKEVNDNFGHEMGDKLLCAVTERLSEISQGKGTNARLGGDEFALVVTGCDTAEEIVTIGESISLRMGQPFMIDSAELVIGGSVGIAICPDDGLDYSELVRRADISMYRAKAAGRGVAVRFDTSMEENLRKKKIMENELRHAIERNELEMVYQPVFAADGETIRGVEALVRWHSPKLGSVSPGEFIPLAEETGLIGEIGDWTVKVALSDAKSWPDIGIAVNVSPAQFRAEGLAESLIQMVQESGIEPKRVEIEVTEGVLIRDADKAAATMKILHDAGMRIALDDFGTGFASLSYLRRFQFDKLKIDQIFIQTLSSERGGGSGSAAIIHNVVALGRSLGMTVQAEGVETLEHHIFLRAAGCHCLQGYYFAKPMSKSDFDAFFAKKRGFGYQDRYYA
jgi:diguanylate cyclase